MRNPAIHIRRSDLIKVLKPFGITEQGVDEVMFQAVKYSITNRVIVHAKTKGKKKVGRLVDSGAEYAGKFNNILVAVRQSAHHSHIRIVRKGDPDFVQLAEVAGLAVEFSKEFKVFPIEQGMKVFAEIGVSLMGRKYGLSKFKYYRTRIFDMYECDVIVSEDKDVEGTKKFYAIWQSTLLKYSTVSMDIKTSDDWVHMVFGRMEADENKASYKHWIEAQFEGLSWLNAVPQLNQFYGNNAYKRYRKYLADKGIAGSVDQDKALPTVFHSEGEREYFELLKKKRAGD